MEKFSLKKRILWISALILACGSGMVVSTPLEAAIPPGNLNPDECKIVAGHIQAIKSYTDRIKAITNDLFKKTTPFNQDLDQMRALREEITAIQNNITTNGSTEYARNILKELQGIAKNLSAAQARWVTVLESKSLYKMRDSKPDITKNYEATQRFMLGGIQRNGQPDGEGLLGHLEKNGHSDLLTEAKHLHANIIYIFNYETATNTSKQALATHLARNKGFSPSIVKSLPSWFFN